MKKLVLTVFCALIAFALHAQVSDNFSDYTVDGKLAQQAQAMGRDYWTTWSEAPGGADDGVIAEVGGNKCLNVGFTPGQNDQVLKLGDKTTGQWDLTFKFNVPAGKDGYFNIKSVFPSADNGTWAIQVYLGCDQGENNQPGPTTAGKGHVYAGASEGFEFDFVHDTWVSVKIHVDLDDDDASIYIDGNLVRNWQYSTGSFGTSNHKFIAAFNIFAPRAAATSNFYIDDVVFGQPLETLYETSFDDVPNNSYVAQSYPTWWDTWSGLPGTNEDALITNEQSSSSPQSAKLVEPNDLLFKAGNKTEGIYRIDFNMYIPNNSRAYFNLQQNFTGGQDGLWGVGVYFNVTATGGPYAGTYVHQNNMQYPFTFPFDTWFPVSMYVNLDDDLAIIHINGTQILEWQYSTQESGGAGMKKLDMVDFFPPETGGVFYIDDFSYTTAEPPPPPPTVSVTPDELEIKLQTNSIKEGTFYIVSEEEGTLRARWSTYIDYSPLATGGTDEVLLGRSTNPDNGVGYSEEFEREIAIKLTPEDYVTQLGGELKQLGYYISSEPSQAGVPATPGSDVTFRVYGQGTAENVPGEILAEKVLTMANFNLNQWNWVDIDPVQLTGQEYWVSVAMTQLANSYPLTTTSGTVIHGGDWLKTGNGGWGSTTADYNWAIQAKGNGTLQRVWGLMDQAYGTTQPASSSEIKVTANSATYDEDIYTANIVVLTNDINHLRIDLPLIMNVSDYFPSSNANAKEVIVNDSIATLQTSGTEFRVTVPCATEILIVVIPEDENATVTGDTGTFEVKCFTSNSYTFTVTAEDGVTTKDYKLTVLVEREIGISELENSVKLFPNPVTDYLHIESEFAIEYITIYDLTGRMVKQIRQSATSIDMSDLATGFYLMKITTDQGEAMHKFVKQ